MISHFIIALTQKMPQPNAGYVIFLITTCPPNMCTPIISIFYCGFIGSIYFWYVWDELKLLVWLVSYFLKISAVAVQPLSSLNLWHFSLCVNVTVMIKEVTDHFAGDECERRWRIDVCQSLADVKRTKEMLITRRRLSFLLLGCLSAWCEGNLQVIMMG